MGWGLDAHLIEHADPIGVPEALDDELLQADTDRLRIARHPIEQALHAIGLGIPCQLGQLPTRRALQRCDQPS